MTMHEILHITDDITSLDSTWQEKKEEEDSQTLRIILIRLQRIRRNMETRKKERHIKAASNDNNNSSYCRRCLKYTVSYAERLEIPSSKEYLGYDNKMLLMVTLLFWRSGECAVTFHGHYSNVHFELVVLPQGQIEELFVFSRTECRKKNKYPKM